LVTLGCLRPQLLSHSINLLRYYVNIPADDYYLNIRES
jgi:hypothetical protein